VTKPWRWPADTPLRRRERVAQSYRAALAIHAPAVCAAIDAEMVDMGQTWVVPTVVTYTDDDLLTAELVKDYAHVSLKTVYQWHTQGLGIKTRDGIRFRFADVVRWTSGDRTT
jgi:hypothetical protein